MPDADTQTTPATAQPPVAAPQEQKPTTVPKAEPKLVPLSALQSERQKRQALESELQALKTKGAANSDTLLDSDDYAHDATVRRAAMTARDERLKAELRQEIEAQANEHVEEVVSTRLTQMQLETERSRYVIFTDADEEVQRTANLFLRDNLENGMDLKEAVREAAKRAQRYAGKADVDLEETPGGRSDRRLPPDRKPSGTLTSAAVEVPNPEIQKLGELSHNERGAAAKSLWKKLLGG